MFLAEPKLDVLAGELCGRDRVLRDDTALVFHFHLQVVVRQNLFAEVEDLCEAPGGEAMIDVVRHVRLEQAGVRGVVELSAAIDEALGYVSDFRDVEMRRDLVAIRQDEARQRLGMRSAGRTSVRTASCPMCMLIQEYRQSGFSRNRKRSLSPDRHKTAFVGSE